MARCVALEPERRLRVELHVDLAGEDADLAVGAGADHRARDDRVADGQGRGVRGRVALQRDHLRGGRVGARGAGERDGRGGGESK